MTTSPPFMSFTPGPLACGPSRTKRWKGRRARTPCPGGRSAAPCAPASPAGTRTGAPRAAASPAASIQRTSNPSESSGAWNARPTSRTPSAFSVPLLMLTMRSRNATASSACASTCCTMRRSCPESRCASAVSRRGGGTGRRGGWGCGWIGSRRRAPAAADEAPRAVSGTGGARRMGTAQDSEPPAALQRRGIASHAIRLVPSG